MFCLSGKGNFNKQKMHLESLSFYVHRKCRPQTSFGCRCLRIVKAERFLWLSPSPAYKLHLLMPNSWSWTVHSICLFSSARNNGTQLISFHSFLCPILLSRFTFLRFVVFAGGRSNKNFSALDFTVHGNYVYVLCVPLKIQHAKPSMRWDCGGKDRYKCQLQFKLGRSVRRVEVWMWGANDAISAMQGHKYWDSFLWN